MAKVEKRKARADIYARGFRTVNPQNKSGYSLDRSKPADEDDKVIVTKGQEYYTWTLYGRKPSISLTYPKRQQLTQSDFLIQVYDIEDSIDNLSADTIEDLESAVEEIISSIDDLASETEDKRSNMPEQLQDSGSGEILGNRFESLEDWKSSLEAVSIDFDESEREEALQERISELIDELQSCKYEGE